MQIRKPFPLFSTDLFHLFSKRAMAVPHKAVFTRIIINLILQCILCEDWYHGRHLLKEDQKLPNDGNYAEMICFGCFEKFEGILAPYVGLSLQTVSKEVKDSKVGVEDKNALDTSVASITEESHDEKKKSTCKRQVPTCIPKAKTMFLTANWRQQLCKCDECLKLYEEKNVAFLIDEEDTVHHYESQAKNEGKFIVL